MTDLTAFTSGVTLNTEYRIITEGKQLTEKRPRLGGATKKAPDGFYTAQEAAQKLDLNISTFRYYVRQGKIKRHVPPMRKEGFYRKDEIDRLASEIKTFWEQAEKGQQD